MGYKIRLKVEKIDTLENLNKKLEDIKPDDLLEWKKQDGEYYITYKHRIDQKF